MASIPFGIEFDRIAPPVPTIAAAAEYDAARRRRTIDFFFERLRPRCIGRLQRLDGDPATGWNRRSAADGSRVCRGVGPRRYLGSRYSPQCPRSRPSRPVIEWGKILYWEMSPW